MFTPRGPVPHPAPYQPFPPPLTDAAGPDRSSSGGSGHGKMEGDRSSTRLPRWTARSQDGGGGFSQPRRPAAPRVGYRGPWRGFLKSLPFQILFRPRALRPQAAHAEARSCPSAAPEEPGVSRQRSAPRR